MFKKKRKVAFMAILTIILVVFLGGCATVTKSTTTTQPSTTTTTTSTAIQAALKNRLETIPASAVKMTPETDLFPPILHSDKYQTPVPLGGGVNTAGGEDSSFILPDGNTLYFFFTPDVNIPAELQVLDGVTGVYVSHKQNNQWLPAERVVLQDEGELSMDGAVCVQGNKMWFASVRQWNLREIDIWTADFKDGRWQNWQNAGKQLNVDYEMGEMHITADGNEIYYHSMRAGGKGGVDIWVTRKVNGEWQTPENVSVVNSPETDGWPFVTQDGNELWFLRIYQGTPAVYVSYKSNGQWSEPELIISQFAGEPSVDNAGNIYFVHHYYKDSRMIEADIYVAYRK